MTLKNPKILQKLHMSTKKDMKMNKIQVILNYEPFGNPDLEN